MTLFVKSYNAIKHNKEKLYATDLLCEQFMCNKSFKETLKEKTIHKYITIVRNDRKGLEFNMDILKENGTFIRVFFHKKRSFYGLLTMFLTKNESLFSSNYERLLQCILFSEFGSFLFDYIYMKGCSNKLQDFTLLQSWCILNENKKNLSINIINS